MKTRAGSKDGMSVVGTSRCFVVQDCCSGGGSRTRPWSSAMKWGVKRREQEWKGSGNGMIDTRPSAGLDYKQPLGPGRGRQQRRGGVVRASERQEGKWWVGVGGRARDRMRLDCSEPVKERPVGRGPGRAWYQSNI